MSDMHVKTTRIEGAGKSAMDIARNRLMVAGLLFLAAFAAMAFRTLELGLSTPGNSGFSRAAALVTVAPLSYSRAEILDRNGEVLATNLEVASLYVDPQKIDDPRKVANELVAILPEFTVAEMEKKLTLPQRKFVWIKRHLSPDQKWRINALGYPALKFQDEERRIYPYGRLASHVLGFVDVDGKGLGGIERSFDSTLSWRDENDSPRAGEPIRTALDIRVQHALAEELGAAIRAHKAKGGAGIVMDVRSGEVVAMVSMPDFDPNDPAASPAEARFNRVSQGVYELGSTLKTFTVAKALEQNIVHMEDMIDARKPIRVAGYTISDDHGKARMMSVPEVFVFSSNIGMSRIVDEMGPELQRQFMADIGLLQPTTLEIQEIGNPLIPRRWGRLASMTISYGHGLSISPAQLSTGIAAMVNGGRLVPATLLAKDEADISAIESARQVISASTSRDIRKLLRMTVVKGTGSKAEALGYRVGGKTGTAEKAIAGGYDKKALISSFMGVFPMDDPQYVVFALLDEPEGTRATHNFAGGGWTAAPVVRNVIVRSAPLLGIQPISENQSLYTRVAHLIDDEKR